MSKTRFITGASSGFGRELAELLLQRGGRMAATVRKPDALQDLAANYGERRWVGVLDGTNSAAEWLADLEAQRELAHSSDINA